MRLGRLVYLSVFHHLQSKIYIDVTNRRGTTTDGLTYQSGSDNWVPSRPAAVKKNGLTQEPTTYTIHYDTGTVVFDTANALTDVITFDFSFNWVDIEQSWPDEEFKRPVVAVTAGPTRERGLEIGGGTWVETLFYLNVFAINEATRDDVAQLVGEVFDEDVPLIDFNLGFPLNPDGTINSSFDATAQQTGTLYFSHPTINRNPTNSFDEYERGRAIVEVTALTTRN